MNDTAEYFSEKARQCRRLVAAIDDKQAIAGLEALAIEFDAKAAAAEAQARSIALLGNGDAPLAPLVETRTETTEEPE
jgi:hypothetical protein